MDEQRCSELVVYERSLVFATFLIGTSAALVTFLSGKTAALATFLSRAAAAFATMPVMLGLELLIRM